MALVEPIFGKIEKDKAALKVLEELLDIHREILEREAIAVFYSNARLKITCNKIACVRAIWAALFGTDMPRMVQRTEEGLELEADADGLRVFFFLPSFRSQPVLQKLA